MRAKAQREASKVRRASSKRAGRHRPSYRHRKRGRSLDVL